MAQGAGDGRGDAGAGDAAVEGVRAMKWWGRKRIRREQIVTQLRGASAARDAVRLADAELQYSAALQAASVDYPELTLESLHGLAAIRIHQLRFPEAFDYLSKAIRLIEDHGWRESTRHAQTLNNMASLRWIEGNRAAAISMYGRAYQILSSLQADVLSSKDFLILLAIMMNFGRHYLSERDLPLAEQWVRAALDRVDPVAEQFADDWLQTVKLLAVLSNAKGHDAEAISIMEWALARWESRFSSNHRAVASLLTE